MQQAKARRARKAEQTRKELAEVLRIRDEALFSLDREKIEAYMRDYCGVEPPKNEIVFWATVYKSISGLKNAPADLKKKAADWLHGIGMKTEDDYSGREWADAMDDGMTYDDLEEQTSQMNYTYEELQEKFRAAQAEHRERSSHKTLHLADASFMGLGAKMGSYGNMSICQTCNGTVGGKRELMVSFSVPYGDPDEEDMLYCAREMGMDTDREIERSYTTRYYGSYSANTIYFTQFV